MLKLIFAFILFVGCGYEENANDERTTEPEEKVVYVEGPPGKDGVNGQNGVDGYSVVYTFYEAASCESGGFEMLFATDTNRNGILDIDSDANIYYKKVCNGVDGKDGVNGTNGQDGAAGKNGVDGKDGVNGQDADLVDIIDPCGKKEGYINEVLIKLSSGKILASVSDKLNGENTRLSIVPAGSYMTSDGTKCKFSISDNGELYNEFY